MYKNLHTPTDIWLLCSTRLANMCQGIGEERRAGGMGSGWWGVGLSTQEPRKIFVFLNRKGLLICFFPGSWAKLLIEL